MVNSQLGIALLQQLARVELKLDALINSGKEQGVSDDDVRLLRSMTAKQHATAQMLLRGASNQEIADRLGVTENTAKVHVRLLAKKLGTRNRSQIVARLQPIFRQITDEEYRKTSEGLPLTWDEEYDSNPLNDIVRRGF